MSMFKKRKNVNLRKRGGSSDEEDAKNDNVIPFIDDVPDIMPTTSSVRKKKDGKSLMSGGVTSRSSASNLLSFDDDEGEGEVFQVKKTIHNKKHVRKFKDKMKDKDSDKKPDARLATSRTTSSKEKKGKDSGVLNGKKTNSPVIVAGIDDEEVNEEEDFRKPFSNLKPGAIPDAAMIHAARKRRQLAREMGDFIPVDDTQRFESNPSRLVRDDDNDRSDNEGESDDEGRISFTVTPAMTQRQRVIEAIEQVDSDDSGKEHNEELQRWEQEQIKKGTSVPQIQDSADEQSLNYQNYLQSGILNSLGQPPPLMSIDPFRFASGSNSAEASPTQNASSLLTKMPPKDLPSITLDQVKKQLKDRLNSLDEVHRAHQREMDTVQDGLTSSESSSVKLKSSFGEMEMQYRFFQEMRGYVRDLVECLNEKVPQINSLETQMHNLWKQRASKLVQRRQDDIKDQSEDFIMKGSKAAAAPNLDPHGRDRSMYESDSKQRRQAEREARRARRRRHRQYIGTNQGHHEGFSSDDEVPDSEIVRFNAESGRLVDTSRTMFEDVVEEFSTFDGVKPHFEKWKHDYSESYTEAYISLCLPKLFSPFIRLQLLNWNPLQPNCADFEEMIWFESLIYYGYREYEGIERNDPDIKLMPSLVEKVILPQLTFLVENVWDPMSTLQTQKLVEFFHRIADDYPPVSAENKNTRNLLRAIVNRMRKTLDDDVYVPLFPKVLLENKASGANAFLQRQFWSCVKLLGNILMWHGIVSHEILQELSLDGILNRYLLLSLQNCDIADESIDKCRIIVSSFPRQWFSKLEGESTIRQLENMCRYLNHTVSTLHRACAGASDMEKRQVRDHTRTVIRILADIHAMDHTVDMANEYNVKDLQSIILR